MIIGISWFQPAQWERLLEISEDREELDDSYEDWRKNASRTIEQMALQGQKVIKVQIDLDDLEFWCYENKLPINGQSRSQYVSHLLHRNNVKR
ncbi:MAG: hypothetical protein Tsb002_13170 [Wenzhouxiangellaceae bacterium]